MRISKSSNKVSECKFKLKMKKMQMQINTEALIQKCYDAKISM